MALPTTTISGSTRITASIVSGPMPPASETQKAAGLHLSHGVDMGVGSVAGQPFIGRRMDRDIAEALRKGRIGRQQLSLAQFCDGIDHDRRAKGRRAPADGFVGGRGGAGKDGHEGRAGAEYHVGLPLACVDRLGVGQHEHISTEFPRRSNGGDPEALQHGRSDLDDISKRLHERQQRQVLGLVEGDLEQHGS